MTSHPGVARALNVLEERVGRVFVGGAGLEVRGEGEDSGGGGG